MQKSKKGHNSATASLTEKKSRGLLDTMAHPSEQL